ncbi:glycosyltransferase family 4 protein [Actinotignum sp. SLA_B059]|uniref:glycosyltransferase family 4 protein n=1 Tax=Actinotignum sp. SLA_B059 TaxID=3083287 RepID=UPI002A8223D6|nr:glycosyltransferase family 4 protein [Actinotignum sp. SLA_B059]MDY5126581.1 glycosyltransferase family 4 protein [Actinotignum sp. SLA_B059]
MRIALVSDCFLPRLGGIEAQTRDLALALRDAGHRVLVITATPRDTPPDPGIPVDRDIVAGIPVQRITSALFGHLPVSPGHGAQLRASMRGADVVHIQAGVVSPFAWAAMRIAAAEGIPTTVTWHCVLDPVEKLLAPLRWVTARGVVHNAVSTWVAAQVHRAVGGDVKVIPNGVDLGEWRTVAAYRLGHRGISAASRTLGVAGAGGVPGLANRPGVPVEVVAARRLAPRKRNAALIDCVAGARQLTGRDIHLTIYGDGPLRSQLERRGRARGNPGPGGSWLHLPGRTDRAGLMEAYRHADIYLTSSRREAFGIATLEARAAGLPIISPAGTGADDFLEDGRSALLAETDADMIAQLARLVEDTALRTRMAHHNASVAPGYGWEEVVPLVLAEYERAIRTSSGR